MVFLFQQTIMREQPAAKSKFDLRQVPTKAEKQYTVDFLSIIMSSTDDKFDQSKKAKNGKPLGEVVNDFVIKNKLDLSKPVSQTMLDKLKTTVGESSYKKYVAPCVEEIKPKK